MPRPGAVLQVEGLGFAHPKQSALFADWSLVITPGVTWLGGDESTGKTTLLRLLAGELSAQQGSLRVNGVALVEQPAAYRSQVAWVDPRTQAFDALSPQAYWERLRSQYPTWNAALLADLIDGLALAPHVSKALYMLSTGTKRKVFLAGTLASGAAVTLLDEPFAALDRASIDLLLDLLQEAATHRSRAWVVADYVAPRGVGLAGVVGLGERSA
ncbi:MAG: ATP-binding cassette domain-containing protein [Rhodoferax sp.]|nr:ATP-binding cassette domain-containing protein [Rhodoferax sp.]